MEKRKARAGFWGAALLAGMACVSSLGVVGGSPAYGAVVGPSVVPVAETPPVDTANDAADDSAIWRDPADPSRSVLIETDKGDDGDATGTPKPGALIVRDLNTGAEIQQITGPRFNNVDLRGGFPIGGSRKPLVVASRQDSLAPAVYALDTATRRLTNVSNGFATTLPNQYGTCMFRMSTATGGERFFVFVNSEREGATDGGDVEQWELKATSAGKVSGTRVRAWDVGKQTEGCVVDDANRDLYIGEETVGIWKYGAAPSASTSPTARAKVDGVGPAGNLTAEVEGLALSKEGTGGHLFASSQGASSYDVYDRLTNAHEGEFRIGAASPTLDAVTGTDGIEVSSEDLGPRFPNGVFVAQDNNNTDDGVKKNQNFKLVDYSDIFGGAP